MGNTLIFMGVFVLFFQTSSGKVNDEVDKVLKYLVTIDKHNGKDYANANDCPHKRPNPDITILQEELLFNNACRKPAREKHPNEVCPISEEDCLQEFLLWKDIGSKFTLSMLFNVQCPHAMRMGMLRFGELSLNILCGVHQNYTLEIGAGLQAYEYHIQGVDRYHHLLIQWNDNKKGKPFDLIIDGKSKPADKVKRVIVQKGSLNKHWLMLGSGSSDGAKNYFVGAVRIVDIFTRTLEITETEYEYRYTKLLLDGAPYPYCVCPKGLSTDYDKFLCSDGTSRLTGSTSQDDFFTPLEALYDGIKNSTLKYGFCPRNLGNYLIIKMMEPSILSKIEIYATEFDVIVDVNICDNGSHFQVFHSTDCSSCTDKILWEEVEGEQFQKLLWQPKTETVIRSLRVDLETASHKKPSTPMDASPSQNAIFEIIIHGRTLNYPNSEHQTCFPNNAEASQKCGRCICRSGNQTLAGKSCKPYITGILPQYGPVAGGTVITLTGGLLTPHINPTCKNTSITIDTIDICKDIFRNDTHIICTTTPLPSNLSHIVNHKQRIAINILVGYSFYTIQSVHHYEYRSNPIITNIKPQKSFLGGDHVLTISGKHMNSSDLQQQNKIMTLTMLGHSQRAPCKVQNSTQMMCTMPKIDDEDTQTALIGFQFDGLHINISDALPNWPKFKIYHNPEFYTTHIMYIYEGDPLILEGKHLDTCCDVDEYTVMIGNNRCNMVTISHTQLVCNPQLERSGTQGLLPIKVQLYSYTYTPGHVHINASSTTLAIAVSLGVGLTIVILAIIAGCIYLVKKKLLRRPQSQPLCIEANDANSKTELCILPTPTILDSLEGDLHRVISDRLIDKEKVQIKEVVGKGNFGKVFRGVLKEEKTETEVALKALKDPENVSSTEATQFLEEATVMRDFNHPNVLSLLGIVVDGLHCYVVLPFMENGNLRKFVRRNEFEITQFLKLILDVARGMSYLGKQKFIHRDLAARNCMVSASEQVLIGDFGLARDIYHKEYYRQGDKRKPLPFKWMAIESIEKRIFTIMSDVWSFGVLMWEVLMKGAMPYPQVQNYQLRNYLRRGHRLEKPRRCPKEMFALMEDCWMKDPNDRPTFPDIVIIIENYITKICNNGHEDEPEDDTLSSSFSDSSSSTVGALPSPEDCQRQAVNSCEEEDPYLTPSKCTVSPPVSKAEGASINSSAVPALQASGSMGDLNKFTEPETLNNQTIDSFHDGPLDSFALPKDVICSPGIIAQEGNEPIPSTSTDIVSLSVSQTRGSWHQVRTTVVKPAKPTPRDRLGFQPPKKHMRDKKCVSPESRMTHDGYIPPVNF